MYLWVKLEQGFLTILFWTCLSKNQMAQPAISWEGGNVPSFLTPVRIICSLKWLSSRGQCSSYWISLVSCLLHCGTQQPIDSILGLETKPSPLWRKLLSGGRNLDPLALNSGTDSERKKLQREGKPWTWSQGALALVPTLPTCRWVFLTWVFYCLDLNFTTSRRKLDQKNVLSPFCFSHSIALYVTWTSAAHDDI